MKYTEQNKGRFQIKTFEYPTIAEFVTALESTNYNKFFSSPWKRQSNAMDDFEYHHTHTYEEALSLLRSGWSPAAEKLAQAVSPKKMDSVTTTRSTPTYDVIGAVPSVPRYLQGLPTAMINRRTVPVKQKTIVLTKSISYSSCWKTHEMLNEGIKVLQLIKRIEAQWIRVKLNVIISTTQGGEVLNCKVTIKKPEERIQISKLAFPIAHPAMLRRLYLRWMEVNPKMTSDFSGSYGHPCATNEYLAPGEYYLPERIDNIDEWCSKNLK